MTGAIEELGGHIFKSGDRDKAERFLKTQEVLAEYAGRVYSKWIKKLVKYWRADTYRV